MYITQLCGRPFITAVIVSVNLPTHAGHQKTVGLYSWPLAFNKCVDTVGWVAGRASDV